MSDTTDLLPSGVHPLDQSMPADEAARWSDNPVPHDQGPLRANRGRAPWSVQSPQALAVFQRLADTLAVQFTVVDANQGGTAKIVNRQPGRTRLSLWVPSSYFPGGVLAAIPAGIMWGPDEGELQQGGGVPLFVGDSADVSSESSVWAGLQPGQAIGVVAWIHCWDTPGRMNT